MSYHRPDEVRAARVATALETLGFSVWRDREIPPSANWADAIGSAIDDAVAVVALWSHTSVKSQWVLKEARRGERQGKLVPARIDDIEPPFEFDHIQAADLVDWDGSTAAVGFAGLADAVRALVQNPPPPPLRTPPPPPPAAACRGGSVGRGRRRFVGSTGLVPRRPRPIHTGEPPRP